MSRTTVSAALALSVAASSALAQLTGPSTSQSAYQLPSSSLSGVQIISIASNGNGTLTPNETFFRLDGNDLPTATQDYRLVGIPDGSGAFRTEQDIIDGTFTWVVNHELGDTSGIVRAHGNRGAFVSRWRIDGRPTIAGNPNPNFLKVIGGRDASTSVKLWDIANSQYVSFNTANPMPKYQQNATFGTQGWNTVNPNRDGFGRHCSADLAPVSAYQWTDASTGITYGTSDRIFMNGEEIGAPGRATAYVLTGSEKDTTYELPVLGDFSWENSVASPVAQRKTIVAGYDDSTPGQVYFYVGNKQTTGSVVERAGLTNGTNYGIKIPNPTIVSGQPSETQAFVLGGPGEGRVESKPFTMEPIGDLANVSGSQLQVNSDNSGVLNLLRPEDGAWDPRPGKENDNYFVTTNSFTTSSRIFRARFNDILNPETGGELTMVADGNELGSFSGGFESHTLDVDGNLVNDVKMMDNFCINKAGMMLIQEDVGNNPRLGRIWLYNIDADAMSEVAISDVNRFSLGSSAFLTQDEEASGIIDAWDIIGPGWFLMDMQAHYGISGELVEGGQLMAMYVPQSVPEPATLGVLAMGAAALLRRRR